MQVYLFILLFQPRSLLFFLLCPLISSPSQSLLNRGHSSVVPFFVWKHTVKFKSRARLPDPSGKSITALPSNVLSSRIILSLPQKANVASDTTERLRDREQGKCQEQQQIRSSSQRGFHRFLCFSQKAILGKLLGQKPCLIYQEENKSRQTNVYLSWGLT